MEANYGYSDASGDYFITLDTDRCDGCARCIPACPQGVLEMIVDDYENSVAAVAPASQKKLRDRCAGCKPAGRSAPLPCVAACAGLAIAHAW